MVTSRRTYVIGELVRLQWGHDVVSGTVVNSYRDASQTQVVVKLEIPPSEPFTVALPASELERLQAQEDSPEPGSWIQWYEYERLVAAAIEVAAVRIIEGVQRRHGRVVSTVRPEFDMDPWDILIRAGKLMVAIDIRFLKKPIDTMSARQLIRKSEGSTLRGFTLVVANVPFTKTSARQLAAAGWLSVTWRSDGDNKALQSALKHLLVIPLSQWRREDGDVDGAKQMLQRALAEDFNVTGEPNQRTQMISDVLAQLEH